MHDLFDLSLLEKIGLYFIIALLFIIVLKYWITSKVNSYKHNKRIKRGYKGEQEAERFLQKNGFSIISKQEEHSYTIYENQNPVAIKLVTDYVAEKDGMVYIVEVKTGSSAPSINNSSTRRQILEYYHALQCDGVILLDMEDKVFKYIDFGDIKIQKKYPLYFILTLIVAVLGIFFTSILLKIAVCMVLLLSVFFYVRK